MQGKNKERWMELCAQVASEQDPDRVLQLVKELNELLEQKERRLGLLSQQEVRSE